MFGENSRLLICPGCNRLFWEDEVPTIPLSENRDLYISELRSLARAEFIYGHHYEDALRQELWKTEAQEKHIRIRAWWSFNNAYREQATEDISLSPEQEANLLRLLQLLDANDPSESLMKAEIFRELGRFDECLKELDRPCDNRNLSTVNAIRELVNYRKRCVAKIKENDESDSPAILVFPGS